MQRTCSSNSGVPTYYGTVTNKNGEEVKFQERHASDDRYRRLNELSLPDVDEVTGVISAVKNDGTKSDSRATSISASNHFAVVNDKLTLQSKVNMKELGGPRHKIELITKSSSCKIYALIMMLPDPDGTETELQLDVEEVESDLVVDGLPFPLTNGISNADRKSVV